MPRIRSLKPGFFRSRSLAKCSIPARLTFQGLWCEADDHGRGIADARLIVGAVWPLDDDVTAREVEQHLVELRDTGHIRLYEVDGDCFYEIVAWEKHQAAAYRRGEAQHPLPPAGTPDACVAHDSARIDTQESAGREVEGKGSGTGNREEEPSPSLALALVAVPSPDPVLAVFEAWQESTGHRKAVLDDKRRKCIRRALQHYPLEDCVDAVRGWQHSPHHAGRNATRTVYDDLTLLLRDSEHIERFRDLERGERTEGARREPANFDGLRRVMAQRAGESA